MAKYIAFLYESPTAFEGLGPEEMQQIVEKYRDWSIRLEEKGHYVGGQKLKDREGRVVRAKEGKLRVTDGPFAESKEVVGGYIALEAADYDEAVRLVEDCPHLGYGGTIELREFDEV